MIDQELNDLNARKKERESEISSLENDARKLRNRLTTLTDDIRKLENRSEQVSDEINDKSKALAELGDAIKAKQLIVLEGKEEAKRITSEAGDKINEANVIFAEAEDLRKKYEDDMASLDRDKDVIVQNKGQLIENQRLRQEIDVREDKIRRERIELDNESLEIISGHQSLEAEKAKLDVMNEEITYRNLQAEKRESDVALMIERNNALREELNGQIIKYDQTQVNLEKEIDKHKKLMELVELKLENLTTQDEQLRKNSEGVENDRRNLRMKEEKINKLIERMKSEQKLEQTLKEFGIS